jgi:hypothetical protein
MLKIGILYICTGTYDIFWKEFYKSCEKNLLTNSEKYYFVFTDAKNIYDEEHNGRIIKIFQENLGWPNNTLKRFSIFNSHKELFNECDYLFFMNANLKVMKNIGEEEFLPIKENLLVTKHPGFYNKDIKEFSYDRNPKSKAYIPYGKGKYYIAGGLNGGKRDEFLKLVNELDNAVEQDLKDNIVALWHDESHLNKYIINRNDLKILDPSFLYPEGWGIPFECKIIIRDKNKYGGHLALRNQKYGLKTKIKLLIKKIIK